MNYLFFFVCCVVLPTSLQTIILSVLEFNGIYIGATGTFLLVFALFGGGFLLKNKLRDAWQDQKNSRKYVNEKLSDETLSKETIAMYKKQLEKADLEKELVIGACVSLVIFAVIAAVASFAAM